MAEKIKKRSFFELRLMNTTIPMLRMFRMKNDPIPVAERMNYGEEKETKVTFLVLQKVIKDGEHSIILFFNH